MCIYFKNFAIRSIRTVISRTGQFPGNFLSGTKRYVPDSILNITGKFG